MKKFSWMQIVRLLVMVIAVAAVIYALEYLPSSPLMWVSVGLLIVGFVLMLFVFRVEQRKRRVGHDERETTSNRSRR